MVDIVFMLCGVQCHDLRLHVWMLWWWAMTVFVVGGGEGGGGAVSES